MLQEAVGQAQVESELSSPGGSLRFRRPTRSEKMKRKESSQMTAVEEEKNRKSLFQVRAEAAGVITLFLKDLQKLFRNILLKYVR